MQGVGRLEARRRPAGAALAVPRALILAHWGALVAAAVTVALGIPTLLYPYGPDQALFAYIGEHLRHGAGLYTDVWDVKPPGIFWIYAAIGLLPGPDHVVLRTFDLLYAAAGAVAIYALGTLLWDRAAGVVAGTLYGAVYAAATGYWHSAQPDSFLVLPLVLATWLYLSAERTGAARLALLGGVLFGVCLLLRPVAVLVPATLAALDLIWTARDRRARGDALRPALERVAALIGGGAAVQVVTLLWLGLHGAAGEYAYAQVDFASAYARRGGPYSPEGLTFWNYLSGLRSGTMFIIFARLLLAAPALAAVLVGGAVRRERSVLLAAALTAAAYLGVVVQGKFFLYHWHLLLPFLALLSGWTADALWRALRGAGRGPLSAAAVLVTAGLLLLLCTPNVTDRSVREWNGFLGYWRHPEERSAYYDRFGLYGRGSFSYRASDEVSGYLRTRTEPGDTLFVWGYDPLLYVSTGMDSPSRFTSFLPLMATWTPRAWQDEFVDDLERRRPAYIILQRNENAPWITGHWIDPADFVPLLPRFQALLESGYDFDRTIEDYILYRRR